MTEHYKRKVYNVYINDDPGLTLNHCKTMSNLVKVVFVLILGPDTYIKVTFTASLVFWLRFELWRFKIHTFTSVGDLFYFTNVSC